MTQISHRYWLEAYGTRSEISRLSEIGLVRPSDVPLQEDEPAGLPFEAGSALWVATRYIACSQRWDSIMMNSGAQGGMAERLLDVAEHLPDILIIAIEYDHWSQAITGRTIRDGRVEDGRTIATSDPVLTHPGPYVLPVEDFIRELRAGYDETIDQFAVEVIRRRQADGTRLAGLPSAVDAARRLVARGLTETEAADHVVSRDSAAHASLVRLLEEEHLALKFPCTDLTPTYRLRHGTDREEADPSP
jgi:hypothetical protein